MPFYPRFFFWIMDRITIWIMDRYGLLSVTVVWMICPGKIFQEFPQATSASHHEDHQTCATGRSRVHSKSAVKLRIFPIIMNFLTDWFVLVSLPDVFFFSSSFLVGTPLFDGERPWYCTFPLNQSIASSFKWNGSCQRIGCFYR